METFWEIASPIIALILIILTIMFWPYFLLFDLAFVSVCFGVHHWEMRWRADKALADHQRIAAVAEQAVAQQAPPPPQPVDVEEIIREAWERNTL